MTSLSDHKASESHGRPEKESLSKKVVRGGIWVLSLRMLNRGLGFVRTIILARLLSPNDFGLFGVAMLTMTILETFSKTGFHEALIQKRENITPYLDTAWTVSIVRGVLLFLILFVSAPAFSHFFASPQTILIIRIIAVSTLLSGFVNIGTIFFLKNLEFHKQFLFEISSAIMELGVGVSLAFLLRNVWALVFGSLAAAFVRLVLSYIIQPYRPKFRFHYEKYRELFSFGKWVLGSGILVFLIMQGDDIFVGKTMGITVLGLYQMAYMLSNLPVSQINYTVGQVTFPAYSKLHNDIQRLSEAYFKVLKITLFISFPLAGVIFLFIPEFTRIFLGEKWLPMVPAAQILVFAALMRSIAATTGRLFYALGKTKLDMSLQAFRLLILAICIYPFSVKWQVEGVAFAVLASIFTAGIAFMYSVRKLIRCKPFEISKAIAIPLINIVIAGTFVLISKRLMGSGLISLGISILLFVSFYFISALFFDRYAGYGMRPLIKDIWGFVQ